MTPARLANQIDPALNALSPFVDVRFTDRRLADDVQSRRRQAIEDFDRNMVTIVQTLRAILRAVGRDDLASTGTPCVQDSSIQPPNFQTSGSECG